MGADNEPATGNSTIKESDLTYHEKVGCGASSDVYQVAWIGKIEAPVPIISWKYGNYAGEGRVIRCLQSLNHANNLTLQEHLPPRLNLEWAIQATKAIKYLHDKNILHRDHQDIKTSNLLMNSEHNLKIFKFGISSDLTCAKTRIFKNNMDFGMYNPKRSETF